MPQRRASAALFEPIDTPPPDGDGTGARAAGRARVAVLLPLPLSQPYDYAVPDGLALTPGAVVRVPLGAREVIGVVWDTAAGDASVPDRRLRPVLRRYDVPPIGPPRRRFIDWVARYTMTPPGAVLRMALNVPAALEAPRPTTAYRIAEAVRAAGVLPDGVRATPARQRVVEMARDGRARPLADLANAAGVSASVVKGLAAAGVLETISLAAESARPVPDAARPGPHLSQDQSAAAEALCARVEARSFSATLLDGVTGSGKTEVYFEAIAAAVKAGRQALVLLPEIALSAQWLDRFTARFGAPPALWHSDLSTTERRATWRAVAHGRVPVVVGARSALFLPLDDLGLIIVDEEHEPAFKQEDGVIYHARDMAVVRAHLSAVPIILASATPSLETVVNVESGRYARVALPERHGPAALPEVELVDLRVERPQRVEGVGPGWLSGRLRAALEQTLAGGEQAMLFLNRRGYAPLTLCRACGHRLQCPNCTTWLVEHRLLGRLQCHHCGYEARLPEACPACGATGELAACGPGVERLAEEAAALFPAARTAIMTSDTVAGPSAAAALVRAVQAREVDLLIGTQIVAKGHHFPSLTLVGVVDADLGLYGGDLRAAERTYQLLHQVAGRAGRAERPGRALVQTAEPDHPVMQALAKGDRDAFLAIERAAREASGMPPFGRLAALILSSADPEALDGVCRLLARHAPRREGASILGPAPAPLAVLRGRHRRRFLVKTRRDLPPQGLIAAWLRAVDVPARVRIQIDIDPYSFL